MRENIKQVKIIKLLITIIWLKKGKYEFFCPKENTKENMNFFVQKKIQTYKLIVISPIFKEIKNTRG